MAALALGGLQGGSPRCRCRTPARSAAPTTAPAKSRPEPVPRSAMRNLRFNAPSPRSNSSASSTTVSVSGRGTSVAAESFSGSPQNSLWPRMRATGSPARRRRAKSSSRVASSAVSCRCAAVIRPVRSRPSTAPTSSRASSSADSIPLDLKRAVSARRAVSTVCPAKTSVGAHAAAPWAASWAA